MPIKIGKYDHWRVTDSFSEDEDYTSHGYTNVDYAEDLHSQAFYELNIITRGNGTHHFGEKTYPAEKGDVFIIPPNILHGYEGGLGFDVYHLLLSPVFMQKNSTNLQRLPTYSTLFHIDPIMRERVSDDLHLRLGERICEILPYLKEMEQIDKSPSIANFILSEALATMVITKLCESYEKNKSENEESYLDDKGFVSSLSYIFDHYNQHIPLNTLLRISNMSRTSYLVKFKKVTGSSPGRFQASYRVTIAKELLADGSKSLAKIATEVGCFDTSHLSKLFLAETGLTPTEYRKKQKSD